jgi:dienelactone hydrolase
MYLVGQVGSQSDGSPVVGFRCVRPLAQSKSDAGLAPLPVTTIAPTYHPVGPAEFQGLLEHYRYDPRPANPRGRTVVETPDWIRERFWIDGPKGDSVLLYMFLPRNAEPPYQALVHIPSTAAFGQSSVPQIVEDIAAGQIKAGRAVIAPVLTGMVEHQGTLNPRPPPRSVEFRDVMVWHATEMRLAMDYAVTRPDIDSTRLGYIGMSFGAGSRLPLAAVDPRFRAVVLLGAGIDERVQPTLPEAANFNFAPYIKAPKLVINGRQDEEHPWQTRGKPLWDLLREPKELLLADGAGHRVPVDVRTPRINAFLDRTLGPVIPRRR